MIFNKKNLLGRDGLIFILIFSFFIVVVIKAVHVQIVQATFLVSEGNKRQIRALKIPAPRGKIFDRNGNLLALSTPFNSIWVDPKILSFYLDKHQQILKKQQIMAQEKKPTEKQLAKWQETIDINLNKYQQMLRVLNLAEKSLTLKILANKKRRFMYVKRSVLTDVAKKIKKIGVAGLFIEDQYKRYYPSSEINGHTIGFTNIDDVGISGLEKTYNDWLTGIEGKKQVIKNRTGQIIEFVKDIKVAKPGNSLHLSIDGDIQYLLHHALKEAYARHLPLSAQAVILDAKTGEVLAMDSIPAFNPNNRTQLTGKRLRNRVIMDRIEPGSPTKPFVIAKALDLGVLSEDELINTSPGYMIVQNKKISDTSNNGLLTAAGIIKKSSNIGVSKVAFKLTPKQQWQMFNDIGFGTDLGIYLSGETLGFIKSPEQWRKIDQASSAFGYGFNINLMQLARAYSIFTNNGVLKPVSLLKIDIDKTKNNDDKMLIEEKQVVSPEVAQSVLKMLEAVAKSGGTAVKAKIDGYRIAGKTGTVHKTRRNHIGYEENQYLSLFVGIVPASNPKYIMATVVNEPSRGVYYGGLVAAPIFKTVMEDVLRLKNISPDENTGDRK